MFALLTRDANPVLRRWFSVGLSSTIDQHGRPINRNRDSPGRE